MEKSIQYLTVDNLKEIKIEVKENKSDSRTVVAYCLYMMQALDLIRFRDEKSANEVLYKITIKEKIKEYWNNLKGLLVEKSDALKGLVDE